MSIIHHIVLGNSVPELNRECIDSWSSLRGQFELIQWTDDKVGRYLANSPLELKRLYDKARNWGEASDILRMAITHEYGGIYVDWDVLLVDPKTFVSVLGDLTSIRCVLLEDKNTTNPNHSSIFTNSLFYMRKGDSIPTAFLQQIKTEYLEPVIRDTPDLTGPHAFTRFLKSNPTHKEGIRTLDLLQVYSFDYADAAKAKLRQELTRKPNLRDAPAIHFWTHSWMPPRENRATLLRQKATNLLKSLRLFR